MSSLIEKIRLLLKVYIFFSMTGVYSLLTGYFNIYYPLAEELSRLVYYLIGVSTYFLDLNRI